MFRRLTLAALLTLFALTTAMAKSSQLPSAYAWSITQPLGQRYHTDLDTLFTDYHRTVIPAMAGHVWATTGNFGASGQEQVFFLRQATVEFFFEDALAPWLHTVDKQQWFNSRVPMTLVSYITGGDKYSNQDRTNVLFSGNAGKRLQVGAAIDYIYSKGSYDYQALKNFGWQAFASYTGDRYDLNAVYTQYSYTGKENGGIIDDRYITDPAAVQGGQTKVDNKSIPTNLTAAHSKLADKQLFLNNRYKVGFWRIRRDSLTDSVVSRTYVPVTSFIWTFDYKQASHRFINTDGTQDTTFFSNTYLTPGGTDETGEFWHLSNTVGVALLEGFNRWAKAGLALYATHEVRRYKQVPDTLANDVKREYALDSIPFDIAGRTTQHLAWIGGQLTKQQGSLLRYNADLRLGIAGDAAGDLCAKGYLETRFRLFSDTASIQPYVDFSRQKPAFLLRQMRSNHFAWNNNFERTTRLRVGGMLSIPATGTRLNVGYETLKNYVFFDSTATPAQHTGAIHVFNASLHQHFAVRAFHTDLRLTYQTTSNGNVLPLPKFVAQANVYVQFRVARVLGVQLGVDGFYYSAYHAPAYQPALMTFYNQHAQKCGNFFWLNAYANFKLKKARFFVTYTHANGRSFGGKNYFSVPHYPLNPARFQLGVSVDFVN